MNTEATERQPEVTPARAAQIQQLSREAQEAARFSPEARALDLFLGNPINADLVTGKKDPKTTLIQLRAGKGNRTFSLLPTDPRTEDVLQLIEAARLAGAPFHLMERQWSEDAPESGIMLDFDIVTTKADAQLTFRAAHMLCQSLTSRLRQDLIWPAGSASHDGMIGIHYIFIVKPVPLPLPEAGRFKYGFHVLAPGVRVGRAYKRLLVDQLAGDPGVKRVLETLGAVDPAGALDLGSASVPVHFIGSCKQGAIPYVLHSVFEVQTDVAVERTRTNLQEGLPADPDAPRGLEALAPPPAPAPELFAPMVYQMRDEDLEGWNIAAEASIALAANPNGAHTHIARHTPSCRPELRDALAAAAAGGERAGEVCADLLAEIEALVLADPSAAFFNELLSLLPAKYYEDRNLWRNVIYALGDASRKSRGCDYEPLALQFSRRYPKFANGTSKRVEAFPALWKSATASALVRTGGRITAGSLVAWAREASPARVAAARGGHVIRVLSDSAFDYGGELTHYNLAKALRAVYGSKYATVQPGENDAMKKTGKSPYQWLTFVTDADPHSPGELWKWRKESAPSGLSLAISETLVGYVNDIIEDIRERAAAAEDEEKQKYYTGVMKKLWASRKNLHSNGWKNGVIGEAQVCFLRHDFLRRLDKEPDVIGVGNGVLRLPVKGVREKTELVTGFHDHLVSKSTPVAYAPFDPSNPKTADLLDMIADIIPETDARIASMMFFGQSISNGPSLGKAYFGLGNGANGKTTLMMWTYVALGGYANLLKFGIFTGGRTDAQKANEAIMTLMGLNYGFIEEIKKGEVLNAAKLKRVVNRGGVIRERGNHQSEITFDAKANIAAATNHPLIIDEPDHGTWRRIMTYTYKRKFTNTPDPDNPWELKADLRFLGEYLADPEYRSAFLSILDHFNTRLVNEYDEDYEAVLADCPTILGDTAAYRNSQDHFNGFVTECVVVPTECTEEETGVSDEDEREGEETPQGQDMFRQILNAAPAGPTAAPAEYTLGQIASLYSAWHSDRYGRRPPAIDENDIANSAIKGFITRERNGALVVRGCRVLDLQDEGSASHRPRPGERWLLAGEKQGPINVTELFAKDRATRRNWWDLPLNQNRARNAAAGNPVAAAGNPVAAARPLDPIPYDEAVAGVWQPSEASLEQAGVYMGKNKDKEEEVVAADGLADFQAALADLNPADLDAAFAEMGQAAEVIDPAVDPEGAAAQYERTVRLAATGAHAPNFAQIMELHAAAGASIEAGAGPSL